jgi:hypothetical protein
MQPTPLAAARTRTPGGIPVRIESGIPASSRRMRAVFQGDRDGLRTRRCRDGRQAVKSRRPPGGGAFLVLVLLLAAGARAAEFKASIEAIGGAWRVTWTLVDQRPIEGQPTPEYPDLSTFRIASGPSVSSSTRIVNGRGSHERSWSLSLVPQREDVRVIGPASIDYGGRRLSSPALRLPRSRDAAQAESPVLLLAQVDESHPVPGQPVTLSLRLLFSQSVRSYDRPQLEASPGFLVEALPIAEQPSVEPYDWKGRSWNSAVIARWLLLPVRSGQLEIDPFLVQVQVEDRSARRRDPFDDFFGGGIFGGRLRGHSVVSSPLSLQVQPLPEAPGGYTGAVGGLRLDGGPDRDSLAVGEALTLSLTLSGRGNLKWIEEPSLRHSRDLERYDTQVEDAFVAEAGGYAGRRVWRTLLVPRAPGDMRIEAVVLPVWNPEHRRWDRLEAGPWSLKVVPGRTPAAAGGPVFSRSTAVHSYGQDIRHILDAPLQLPRDLPPPHHRPLWQGTFVLCLVLPPLAGLAGRQLRRRRADAPAWRRRQALAVARRSLAAAGDDPGAIEAAWRGYFAHRQGATAAGLVLEEIEEQLEQQGFAAEGLAAGRRLRARLELARYGGQQDAAGLGADVLAWLGSVEAWFQAREVDR